MIKNTNNKFNDYVFNVTRSFISAHLIGAYHTAIHLPYCHQLIHDTLWGKVNFVFSVVKGSIKILRGEEEIVVNENQIIFGETGNDVFLLDNGNEAEFFSFYFQIFNYSLPSWVAYSISEPPINVDEFNKLLQYMRMKSNLGLGSANATFMNLIFRWLRKIHSRKTGSILHSNIMLEAQLYINAHIEEKITVNMLAKKYHFSEKHFRHLFSKVIGISPKKYIETVKLEYAFELLKNSTLTVSEIAEKLEFSSVRHFVTYFKKAYQITPSKCRKQ